MIRKTDTVVCCGAPRFRPVREVLGRWTICRDVWILWLTSAVSCTVAHKTVGCNIIRLPQNQIALVLKRSCTRSLKFGPATYCKRICRSNVPWIGRTIFFDEVTWNTQNVWIPGNAPVMHHCFFHGSQMLTPPRGEWLGSPSFRVGAPRASRITFTWLVNCSASAFLRFGRSWRLKGIGGVSLAWWMSRGRCAPKLNFSRSCNQPHFGRQELVVSCATGSTDQLVH